MLAYERVEDDDDDVFECVDDGPESKNEIKQGHTGSTLNLRRAGFPDAAVTRVRNVEKPSSDDLAGQLWLYVPDSGAPIGIRAHPDVDGQRTSYTLQPGDAFRVTEERAGEKGITYLRLADKRGWVFDRKPDGGTMCVRLDAPPLVLHVSSPSVHKECSGEYMLVDNERPNGQPLWQQKQSARWIYSSPDGKWFIGGQTSKDKNFVCRSGYICRETKHQGVMPDQVRGLWQWGDGRSWKQDPSITVTVAETDYLVDNEKLNAKTLGLGYCFSKQLDDSAGRYMYKTWGTIVSGVDQGDGWLKVGDQYLPMLLEGVQVLIPKSVESSTAQDFTESTPEQAAQIAEAQMVVEVEGAANLAQDEEERQIDVHGELREDLLPFAACCCRANGERYRHIFSDAPEPGVHLTPVLSRLVSRVSL